MWPSALSNDTINKSVLLCLSIRNDIQYFPINTKKIYLEKPPPLGQYVIFNLVTVTEALMSAYTIRNVEIFTDKDL